MAIWIRLPKKQSGGENQAPFFVATLAAFRRVYDQGHKQAAANLGLVVMDEAFSKLSGDRIDDCLALARNFGLQLRMAFPEDRLPTMAKHADNHYPMPHREEMGGAGRDHGDRKLGDTGEPGAASGSVGALRVARPSRP